MKRAYWPLALVFGAAGCAEHPPSASAAAGSAQGEPSGGAARPAGPYLRILGTAQDGGLPQIGCRGPHCRAAHADPARARAVTSLLLVDPRHGQRFLFEASPDLPAQVQRAHELGDLELAETGRPALFDGILLTHAHAGHYTGLLHLGREAYGGATVPVLGTPRLLGFLTENGPWSLAFEDKHLAARPLEPYARTALTPDVSVTAIPVPHREEFSDTVGWLIEGPTRAVFFLPDIDKWEAWDSWERDPGLWERWSGRPAAAGGRLEELLDRVDVALVDGTFFADGEIPGRSMAEIPHPFIHETLARLGDRPLELRSRVVFVHLNHTNPATDPASEAAAQVRASGAAVASEGQRIDL